MLPSSNFLGTRNLNTKKCHNNFINSRVHKCRICQACIKYKIDILDVMLMIYDIKNKLH